MNKSYSLSSLSASVYVKRPVLYYVGVADAFLGKSNSFNVLRPGGRYNAEMKNIGSGSLDQPETEFPTVYGYIQ